VIRSPRAAAALALGGVLLLALALRVIGVTSGLPLPLLNPDEASIVPRAWEMTHGGGLDPGWYDYPSLLMLLLAPVQWLLDEPSYGAARAVAVLIGLAGVGAAWWLGTRAYGRRAGLVGALAVAVATTHVAYSRVAVTDVLLTTLCTVALALLVVGRLEWAGVAAGLAASAKYPGAVLAVPLVVSAWGAWRRLVVAAALGALAFALTSPFVLIHAGEARADLRRVRDLARDGWLGLEDDPVAPVAVGLRLWDALGPALLVSAAALVVLALRRTRADLVLLAFVGTWWAQTLTLGTHFDRYVLPLVPVLGVAAGSLRRAAPVFALLLAVPLVWSLGDARELRGEDARLQADAWIRQNVPAGDVIAADPSTLPLPGRSVIRLELPGPGRGFDPRRDVAALRAQGVRWVLVSGAVTERVLARRDLYPREAAFYDRLAEAGEIRFARTGEEPGTTGPWVRVVRLPG
jgi:4-amino-4-deoxy-L-arabinose transferase-like glycosyltransferase